MGIMWRGIAVRKIRHTLPFRSYSCWFELNKVGLRSRFITNFPEFSLLMH